MPMFDTLLIFAGGVALALLATAGAPALRRDLRSARFAAALLGASLLLSVMSVLVGVRDHAGTGWVVRHGWPKPYLFRFTSEEGGSSSGFEALYFAGNSLAYAGLLLLLWSAYRLAKRARQSARARQP